MARSLGRRYDHHMDWHRQISRQIFYAALYGSICGLGVALAVWTLFDGDRVSAAVIGVASLPFAVFMAMRLNNWRLIRGHIHA
jgi:hypothetical protein